MRATESPDALISSIMKYLFLFHTQDFALDNVIASEAVELLELGYGHVVGSGNLGAVIEVGVDVAGRSDVAVAQPLLNILEGNTVGIEKGRAGVP
jgi:hypothetical protein